MGEPMTQQPAASQHIGWSRAVLIADHASPPDTDPEILGWVVWNFTGYPQFWCPTYEGERPEECLARQVREFWAKRPDLEEMDSA